MGSGAMFYCPSLSCRVCLNSCPLSQWCHRTISSSVDSFPSCPQSFPVSRSFPRSQLLASAVQSTGVTISASVFPMKIQGWFPLEMIGFIPSLFRGFLRVFFSTTVRKHQFLALNLIYGLALTSNMTTGKTKDLTIWTFVSKVMSLIFNTLSRSIIAFLPRSKHFLISWLQ